MGDDSTIAHGMRPATRPTTGAHVTPCEGSVIQYDLNHKGDGGARDRSEEMTHRADKSTTAVFALALLDSNMGIACSTNMTTY